ncbi:hemerythrin domain-containing protein [Streptomyces sp. NPDC001250]|uniref:hemerythrin domain-containing protein n=1 Tax=unclassified Streptomyces TaxID=2593676 RepID=UPI00332BB691
MLLDEVIADHREVEEMFGRLQAIPTGGRQLRDLSDELTTELGVLHPVAEEQYLHAAVREHTEGGARLADKEIADHGRVEKILGPRPWPPLAHTPPRRATRQPASSSRRAPAGGPDPRLRHRPRQVLARGFGDVPGAGPPRRDARPLAPEHEQGTA